MNKIPVIIDCDPGIDDAHALLLAMSSSRLDVKAITTVNGNMPVEITTANALRILELAGKDIPVARGADKPLVKGQLEPADMFHGASGLGHTDLPLGKRQAYDKDAIETIYEVAVALEGQLHLIALGPLTNIALLLQKHPDVTGLISHLTIMGGSWGEGNITPAAEFNFFVDPEAADIVMRSGIPMTLVDLEGCKNAGISREAAADILNVPSSITGFVDQLFQFNFELYAKFGQTDFVIHDSITVAAVIDPSIITASPCTVEIVTGEDESSGASRVQLDADAAVSRITISTDVDLPKYLSMIREMMSYYGKKGAVSH